MSYKTFDLSNDVASIVSAINEVVSISASIFAVNANTKYFQNIASASNGGVDQGGYWESAYDASPTSSLSTALFDASYGFATGSSYNVSVTTTSSLNEKIKVYRLFANLLLGNPDNVFNINSTDRKEAFFLLFKRGVAKDEIKKGTVNITINPVAGQTAFTASDSGASTAFKQGIGGDYAPLKYNGTGSEVGQVWYNAGVVILHPDTCFGNPATWSGSVSLANAQPSGTINQLVDGLRTAGGNGPFGMQIVSINNQTNLFSTVYFCRAANNEFNYSSNPTFTDSSKRILVTSGSNILQTRTYITRLGLYDANDNLLAVACLNKPIAKSPDTESIFRIRLDY